VCRNLGDHEWYRDYNLTAKLLQNIKKRAAVDWIRKGSFLWNNQFDVPLAKIMTVRGMGFTFNSYPYKDLFHVKKYENLAFKNYC